MESQGSSVHAALTSEQWEARDYRPRAADVDAWARQSADGQATDDATEYVAKLGLTKGGEGVIVMSRAHETVVVPPPARHALAALALHEQRVGFTRADLDALRRAAEWAARAQAGEAAEVIRRVADRVEALLPQGG